LPQLAQLFESVRVLTQAPLQSTSAEEHPHVPGPVVLLHVRLPLHVPQFAVGQLVPSEAEPQLLEPHTAALQPPHVPGAPLHAPAPAAHVPQFCVLPQLSVKDPQVAFSDAHVAVGVHEHVPPPPLAPLQIFGSWQLPQFGVLPQLSVKEPHVKPCDSQLSVALHEQVPAPFAPVVHISGAVQVPHVCVTLHSSTNEPQLSPSDLHVLVAVQPHVPGPPAAPLQSFGAAHVPQDTMPPHPSDAMPQLLLSHGLAAGIQLHVPLPLQWDPWAQTWPQLPQLLSSFLRFTHAPLHALSGPEHATVQALALHTALPLSAPVLGPEQVVQAAPPVPLPHSVTVWAVVTHPWLSQHPAGHVVPSHAAHVPPWQTRPVPHVSPSRTATGFVHCTPAEQDSTPTWHWFPFGLHCAPAAHAKHDPLPSHAPLAPPTAEHDVPAGAAVPKSIHVAMPAVQALTLPTWHALAAGWHDVPTWHAAQAPALQ
jgi:hypothetical protein